jgi:23S rRNA pseudouridine2605 synthase
MAQMRLNKIIADAGITSRRGADELIEDGRVAVNGIIVREMGSNSTLKLIK